MEEQKRNFRYSRPPMRRPVYHGQPRQPASPAQTANSVAPVQQAPKPKLINLEAVTFHKKLPKLSTINIVSIIVALVALGAAGFFYNRYQKTQDQLSKQNIVTPSQIKANQDKIAKTVAAVSKLTTLPQGETPSLAIINDITKLKAQPFFANGQNGDLVLIYTSAKLAYLYRPSTNILINEAPVSNGSTDQQGTSSTTTSGQTGTTYPTAGH